MGPTAHQAHLAYPGSVGQNTVQVHGIAHGPLDKLSISPLRVFAHCKTIVAKLSAFRYSRFAGLLCVCSVCTHLLLRRATVCLATNLQMMSLNN